MYISSHLALTALLVIVLVLEIASAGLFAFMCLLDAEGRGGAAFFAFAGCFVIDVIGFVLFCSSAYVAAAGFAAGGFFSFFAIYRRFA